MFLEILFSKKGFVRFMEEVNIFKVKNKKIKKEYIEYGKIIVILIILSVLSIRIALKDYYMFHTLIELIIMNLAVTISFISKNTYRVSTNNYSTFFGLFCAAIAVFNAIHLFYYRGYGDVELNDVNNIAMQASIIVEMILGLSLMISTLFLHKKISIVKVSFIYFLICAALASTILYWRIFPSCYSLPDGTTLFKKVVNLIVALCLLAAIVMINKKDSREQLHGKVYILMNLSIVFAFVSEISFMFYKFLNENYAVLGHLCKLISFYLMYKAVSETSLQSPYKILFYELSQANSKLKYKNIELKKINNELKREIKERKATEEALRESEERYKQLVELCPDGIVACYDNEIFFANKYSAKMLGFESTDELKHMGIQELIKNSYKENFFKDILEVKSKIKESALIQEKLIKADGSMVDVEIKASCIPYNRKEAVLVVIRDIEERKKAEENEKLLNDAMEYDKIKNEFFANISHELRTPINVIYGVIQLVELYLNKDMLQEHITDVNKYSKIMKQNCYRLLRLINNLIDITKIDAGFFTLHIENNNIVSIVENITMSVVEYAKNKGLYIEFDTDVEEKIMAFDPDKIERILLNLLSNCIKFTRPGDSIKVNVKDCESSVILTVEDTGIGIPEEKLNVIFERFRQVDKSLTRNNEGSGIGLSIVKSMVELHEGSIMVESEYGKGSKFIIELPVRILPKEILPVENRTPGNIERINIEFSDIYL
jgi:PAS domain S-box-containing protein